MVPFTEDSEKYEIISTDPDGTLMKELLQFNNEASRIHDMIFGLMTRGIQFNENALNHPKMQYYMKDSSTKFDIVIVQTNFAGKNVK